MLTPPFLVWAFVFKLACDYEKIFISSTLAGWNKQDWQHLATGLIISEWLFCVWPDFKSCFSYYRQIYLLKIEHTHILKFLVDLFSSMSKYQIYISWVIIETLASNVFSDFLKLLCWISLPPEYILILENSSAKRHSCVDILPSQK